MYSGDKSSGNILAWDKALNVQDGDAKNYGGQISYVSSPRERANQA